MQLFLPDFFPHFDSSQADFGDGMERRLEDADAKTTKGLPVVVIHGAVFAWRGPLENFSGQILAKDGPFGVTIAFGIVGRDELPFGCPALARIATITDTRPEWHATGDKSGSEIVPAELNDYDDDNETLFYGNKNGFRGIDECVTK